MNRERRIADLYEGVKSITDPDAFQRVIASESEDYVLADLRNQFWDGKGDKPWQVTEINRLLTRRRELRGSSRTEDHHADNATAKGQPAKAPSLKERVENNLIVFFLGALASGFVAGIGAYQGVLKIIDYTPVASETLRTLKESAGKKSSELNAEPIKHLVRSEAGDHPPATVNLVNSSGRELDLVWIDTNGAEQQFRRITAGGLHSIATFSSHLWLVKDATSGEQLLLLVPRGTRPHTVTVDVSSR